MKNIISAVALGVISAFSANAADETRLLRQPTLSDSHIGFVYGGDVWVSDLKGENLKDIVKAAEEDPVHPDKEKVSMVALKRAESEDGEADAKDGGLEQVLT